MPPKAATTIAIVRTATQPPTTSTMILESFGNVVDDNTFLSIRSYSNIAGQCVKAFVSSCVSESGGKISTMVIWNAALTQPIVVFAR